ncbi:MAG: hypothetical protein WC997_06505 [Porticoccaceae bacterium]
MSPADHWAARPETATLRGMRLLIAVYRHGGIWPFRLCLAPVVLCYALFHGRARRASADYRARMHRINPAFPPPRPWHFVRHLWQFANALLDKLAVWMGDITRDRVMLHGSDTIDDLLQRRRGALILISHLGNFEICQALSETRPGLRLTVLHHTANAAKFNAILAQYNRESRIELLQVADLDVATAIRLNEKIGAGEFVAIAADRVAIDNDRSLSLDFLGAPAPFPLGPFALAVALEAPVLTIHCLKHSGRYHIHFDVLWQGGAVPRNRRGAQRHALARAFAARLAHHCLAAPWQWYNFFPFWESARVAHDPQFRDDR